MKNVRISIIIPAYNEARHLPACLEAVAAQTLAPYEVVVVDNNSRDATAAIAQKYPFVHVIHESRQGIAFARNAGFEAAMGDVLARIDADTHVPPDWIERIAAFYREPGHERSVLTGGCWFYNLRSGVFAGRMYDFIVHHTNRLLLGYYFPWGSNTALPRAAWLDVRNSVHTQRNIHEDLDLGMQLADAGYRAVYQQDFRVGAAAKRLMSHHDALWPYLAMWPRTFMVNSKHVWPLVWPLAAGVWVGSFGLIMNERVLRRLQKKKRPSRG